MADDKNTVVQLVAIERGFLNGRLVEPGKTFAFDTVGVDGKTRKLPKWAAKEGEAKFPKVKQRAGDLKPVDTQAAVKLKIDAISNPV
jgi:hypothetical protein